MLSVVLVGSVPVLPASTASAQAGGAFLDGAEPWTESDCAGDVAVVVGSDAKAQSDIYSAVTLAGVLGTDCVVLAGHRDGVMPANQRARLDAAASGGYVVGGPTAVADAKVAGRNMERIGGATRWETARLIGVEARALAGLEASDPAATPDPTPRVPSDVPRAGVVLSGAEAWVASDCAGDVPVVVGSDAQAQSDIYSAVTLAGFVGTDCVILAGPRGEEMPASQRMRLAEARGGGFVVGGSAAVPSAKVAGRDMVRLAGTDRWLTAHLVGKEAFADTSGTSEPGESEASELYGDVEPSYWDEEEERPAGRVYDAVNRLRGLGVFDDTDCGENKFCPDDPVDRKTFAVWLIRVLDGDDAPDLVGPEDIDPKALALLTPKFEDVPKTYPQSNFIERLYELEITAGCSLGPARYCPDNTIPSGQLATFISRALNLPKAEPIGFWDVDEDSSHFDHINRLVAASLDDGCSEIRFVPFNFCPKQAATRGELAELLSEVVDYIEASQLIKITEDSDPDNSIRLSVDHKELRSGRRIEVDVSWRKPAKGKVSHYVLQWRPSWGDFSYRNYQVVEPGKKSRYSVELPQMSPSEIYAVRVIVAYDNKDKDRLATNEVKVDSQSHQLRDAIKTHVVDAHGQDHPWLVDTWRHVNGPHLSLYPYKTDRVTRSSIGGAWGQIKQVFAGRMSLNGFGELKDPHSADMRAAIEELGHVYTLTDGVTENGVPVAAGHLYLELLVKNHATKKPCVPAELYGNMAVVAFRHEGDYKRGPRYWNKDWRNCRFDLNQKTNEQVVKDVRDITKKVFLEQEAPQWFYDRYQKSDDSIDLDKLWDDVSLDNGSRSMIVYGLRNEFGGYCSTEEISRFVAGEIDSLDTPWRDAGNCPDE